MDVSQTRFTGQGATLENAPTADPRLQPTPDYGTLGPGSDVAVGQPESSADPIRRPADPRRYAPVLAAAIGVLMAVLAGSVGSAHAAWSRFENLFSSREASSAPAREPSQLDRMKPQKQAEP